MNSSQSLCDLRSEYCAFKIFFFFYVLFQSLFVTREKAEKEDAERAKLQQAEESDDGVVVSKVMYY